ncbi:unnamed protein product [Amoebophrya sp. A25]|nr:unnamed protein product [Amoebophrya sp. A25]|eukprot:GSA25T00026423001.1
MELGLMVLVNLFGPVRNYEERRGRAAMFKEKKLLARAAVMVPGIMEVRGDGQKAAMKQYVSRFEGNSMQKATSTSAATLASAVRKRMDQKKSRNKKMKKGKKENNCSSTSARHVHNPDSEKLQAEAQPRKLMRDQFIP